VAHRPTGRLGQLKNWRNWKLNDRRPGGHNTDSEQLSARGGVGTASPHSSPRDEPRPQIIYARNNDKSGSPTVGYPDLTVGNASLGETALEVKLLFSPRELQSGESVNATLEISCRRLGAGMLEVPESVAPKEMTRTPANCAVLDEELVERRYLKLDPFRTCRLSLVLGSAAAAKIVVDSKSAVNDESANGLKDVILPRETQVVPVTPIMEFLARAFAEDYLQRRLSFEQSGWRGLMHIVNGLKVPKSHAYGETRYGRTFGRPLEILIKAGVVEYRTFRGKGRGGNVLRVRACYERECVKKLVNGLADNSPNPARYIHEQTTQAAEEMGTASRLRKMTI
jgi:hypothetical protein